MNYLLFKGIKPYVYYRVIFIFKLCLKFLKLIFKHIYRFLKFRKLLVRKIRSRYIKQFVKLIFLFSRKFNKNQFIRSRYCQKISSNIKVISHQRYIINLIIIKLNQKTKQYIYKIFSKSLIIPLYS